MATMMSAMQDELGRITISTAGCFTALGTPVLCNSEGIFDLRWESQLQVLHLCSWLKLFG